MSDQELLVLAAKASGVKLTYDDGGPYFIRPEYEFQEWNPLLDDGDALRLAVKVLNWPHGGRAFDNAVLCMSALNKLPPDPYEATRKAIVMAAAEIGRGMK